MPIRGPDCVPFDILALGTKFCVAVGNVVRVPPSGGCGWIGPADRRPDTGCTDSSVTRKDMDSAVRTVPSWFNGKWAKRALHKSLPDQKLKPWTPK
jgi:hypothetical protein